MDRFLLKRKATSQDVPENLNWKEEIQYDPGKRKLIEHYHPNLKELVRSDDVICYVEKEEMKKVTNDQVVKYFMALKDRMY